MLLSAKLFAMVVISLFLYISFLEVLCSRSALKSYVQCNLIPVPLANLVLPLFLLSMGVSCCGALR